jgi:hypothetical protein
MSRFLLTLTVIAFTHVASAVGLPIPEEAKDSTLNEDPPYLLDESGTKIVFRELLRSEKIDLIKLEGDSYDLMITAQYKWLDARYPDRVPDIQAFGGIALHENSAQASKCGDDLLYFDMHKFKIVGVPEKYVYFDISNWKEMLCDIGQPFPSSRNHGGGVIFENTLDRHYRGKRDD